MRIVFMGTPDFAVPVLHSLVNSRHQVIAVVTGCDKPSGRNLHVCCSPVKTAALTLGVPVLQPQSFTDPTFLAELKALNPDAGAVVAFQILPEDVYGIPRLGCINLHGSLLPELRGAAPINWAIMRGYTVTGLTTFQIARKVDTGNILLREEIGILPDDDFGSLAERMCHIGGDLLVKTFDLLEAGTISPIPQTGTPTSSPKLTKETARIRWEWDAMRIHNQIRGLSPSPGAFTLIDGKLLKIFRSVVIDSDSTAKAGTVIRTDDGIICVATGKGTLGICELQLEGKKRMMTAEFLKGRKRLTIANC